VIAARFLVLGGYAGSKCGRVLSLYASDNPFGRAAREAISMLHEEGLEQVFQRHLRLSEATRRAVRAWGLELLCLNSAEYSPSCTAILMPDGFDEAQFRSCVLDYYNLSLGAGLGKVAGRVFRIGHLGDLNDLMLCGTLCGVEMGLARFGVPHSSGGVSAAMQYLAG
jgi:alanine-glyoxylate transaminase/serine-glyoxylate transaminase/serine-pyruvate transaminase